jgi:hypothetical protein
MVRYHQLIILDRALSIDLSDQRCPEFLEVLGPVVRLDQGPQRFHFIM